MTILLSLSACGQVDTPENLENTQENTDTEIPTSYYDDLREGCKTMSDTASASGCIYSVETMESQGYREATRDGEDTSCPDGMEKKSLRSPGTLTWCEPATPTP